MHINFCGGITRLKKALGKLQSSLTIYMYIVHVHVKLICLICLAGSCFTYCVHIPMPYVQATILKLLHPLYTKLLLHSVMHAHHLRNYSCT